DAGDAALYRHDPQLAVEPGDQGERRARVDACVGAGICRYRWAARAVYDQPLSLGAGRSLVRSGMPGVDRRYAAVPQLLCVRAERAQSLNSANGPIKVLP